MGRIYVIVCRSEVWDLDLKYAARRENSMQFPQYLNVIDMFQHVLRIDQGKFAGWKWQRHLIQVVNDVDAR